jgi:hypothetical protein
MEGVIQVLVYRIITMDGESGLVNRSTPDLQDLRGGQCYKAFLHY